MEGLSYIISYQTTPLIVLIRSKQNSLLSKRTQMPNLIKLTTKQIPTLKDAPMKRKNKSFTKQLGITTSYV